MSEKSLNNEYTRDLLKDKINQSINQNHNEKLFNDLHKEFGLTVNNAVVVASKLFNEFENVVFENTFIAKCIQEEIINEIISCIDSSETEHPVSQTLLYLSKDISSGNIGEIDYFYIKHKLKCHLGIKDYSSLSKIFLKGSTSNKMHSYHAALLDCINTINTSSNPTNTSRKGFR
ncbi:hypothetical protein MIS46_03700 [Wielerella bovis]|uniref:hypothetical protein n=1 Tax=Wielerella bovis TaxID=2917790 RepID=UPI002018EFAB|nr:hypothetical protein [Wielerella bovis]ULJ63168.1 hypothetical protein MIS46_03700 [Wielerella bovis]